MAHPPGLVSLLLVWCHMANAEDNVHTDILLMGCLSVQRAAQREVQLLGCHMQQLQSSICPLLHNTGGNTRLLVKLCVRRLACIHRAVCMDRACVTEAAVSSACCASGSGTTCLHICNVCSKVRMFMCPSVKGYCMVDDASILRHQI